MFKYSKMQKKVLLWLVCVCLAPVSVCLPWRMPRLGVAWGSSHCWTRIFSVFKLFYVIVKIVTPIPTKLYLWISLPNGLVHRFINPMAT